MPTSGGFARRALLCALLATVAMVLLNLVADPYGVWRLWTQSGFNAVKLEWATVELEQDSAIVSAILRPPVTLLIGSSRVRRGFDEATAARLLGGPALIAGIDAISARQEAALFADLLDRGPVRNAVVEVEFSMFGGCRETVAAGDALSAVARLSLTNSLIPSLQMVRRNAGHIPSGSRLVGADGRYFEAPIAESDRPPAPWPLLPVPQTLSGICVNRQRDGAADAPLRNLIEKARARGTQVTLVILPVRIGWQALADRAGLGPAIDDWKRHVTALAWRYGVPIWDFETSDPVATAGFDGSRDIAAFWDAMHFKTTIGDLLLARLAGLDGLAGEQLTPEGIDAHLTALRDERTKFLAHHPAFVEAIDAAIAAQGPSWPYASVRP